MKKLRFGLFALLILSLLCLFSGCQDPSSTQKDFQLDQWLGIYSVEFLQTQTTLELTQTKLILNGNQHDFVLDDQNLVVEMQNGSLQLFVDQFDRLICVFVDGQLGLPSYAECQPYQPNAEGENTGDGENPEVPSPNEGSGDGENTETPKPNEGTGDGEHNQNGNNNQNGENPEVPNPNEGNGDGENPEVPNPNEGDTPSTPNPNEGDTPSTPNPNEGDTPSTPDPNQGGNQTPDPQTPSTPDPAPSNPLLGTWSSSNGKTLTVSFQNNSYIVYFDGSSASLSTSSNTFSISSGGTTTTYQITLSGSQLTLSWTSLEVDANYEYHYVSNSLNFSK